MENNLTEKEEKSLVGVLYNHISLGTTLEVFGEINEGGVGRMDTMRGIFEKLIRKYNLTEAFTQENYLLLGLKDLLNTEYLEECAKNDKNKHLQFRANYFLGLLKK